MLLAFAATKTAIVAIRTFRTMVFAFIATPFAGGDSEMQGLGLDNDNCDRDLTTKLKYGEHDQCIRNRQVHVHTRQLDTKVAAAKDHQDG